MNSIFTLPLEYKKSARHSSLVDGSNRTSSLTHARYTPILDTDWFWHLQKPSYDEENGPNVSGTFSYAKGCLHLSSLCIAVYVKSCPEKQYGGWQCWGRRVAEMGIGSACHTELCDITWTLWPSDPSVSDIWHSDQAYENKSLKCYPICITQELRGRRKTWDTCFILLVNVNTSM